MAAVIRLLSLAILLAMPVAAQDYRGNLRGTVWNPDGSAAAGVPIVIVSESTGESRHAVSGPDGAYAIAGLLPGEYRIATRDRQYAGFAARTKIAVAQSVDLDLRLGAVPITAAADVRETVVPVDRWTPAVTTRIDGTFLTQLPFDRRHVLDAPLLAPGTTPGEVAIASNGMGDLFTAYLLDGVYDIEPRLGVPAALPQLDAIEEIEIRGAAFGVSFGRTAGAQVNVITRSGTNVPAGGAFGFFQTEADRPQLGGFAGGPVVRSQTFLFGSYQFTGRHDALTGDDNSQLLSGRMDHLVGGSSRITGRYGLDDGRFDRRGQTAGATFHTAAAAIANEARAGLTRVAFGDGAEPGGPESQTYQLANATTWTRGAHLLSGGVEWYGAKRSLEADGLAGSMWSLFVQDDWRALPSFSIAAGARFDRASSADDTDAENNVSPRLGFAWITDREAQTVVRGGYGLNRNYTMFDAATPRVDAWSVGVEHQMGRGRAFEAAYIGNRIEHPGSGLDRSRYNAMQLEFQQRSETGITAIVAYTYGKWSEAAESEEDAVRAPLDSRHRVSTAFVGSLPFGKDRRWFPKATAAMILGDMALSGVFTVQTGPPVVRRSDVQGPTYRNVDLALLKNVGLGDGTTLQLRAEMFNVANRRTAGLPRRYQFGGRLLF